MSGTRLTLFLTLVCLSLAACEEQPIPEFTAPPPLYVPAASKVQSPRTLAVRPPDPTPYMVLPAEDGDVFIARNLRTAIGSTSYEEFAAYSIYTYDSQCIGIGVDGYGYRYRMLYQSGVSYPPPPAQ